MNKLNYLLLGLFSILLAIPCMVDGQTGAKIRLENMTKLPGTDIGFPSDTWYVFNRHRTNMNANKLGHIYSYCDKGTIRIHNDGSDTLVIRELVLSDPSIFAFQKREFENYPIKVASGAYHDLIVQFVKNEAFWDGAKGVYFSDLTFKSNAGEPKVTLAGAYQLRPEGGYELVVRDIQRLFGFNIQVPPTKHTPNYPTLPKKLHTWYGELVVSEYWEQADANKPVIAMVIMVNEGGGNPGLKAIDKNGNVVSGFEFEEKGKRMILGEEVWIAQTVFPKTVNDPTKVIGINVPKMDKPFRLAIGPRTTSGTGEINPETGKPNDLPLRLFHVKDELGIIKKPNDYMLIMDHTPIKGSHTNSDFNDYIIYISNIRPKDNKPEIDWTIYK